MSSGPQSGMETADEILRQAAVSIAKELGRYVERNRHRRWLRLFCRLLYACELGLKGKMKMLRYC